MNKAECHGLRQLRPYKKDNNHRMTQTCTTNPMDAPYPEQTTSLQKLHSPDSLPDGAPFTSRNDPTKVITTAQGVLDDSLETEYSGMFCEGYFDAVIDTISIIVLVFIKHFGWS